MKHYVALFALLGLAAEAFANPCRVACVVRKVAAVKVVKQVIVKNRVIAVQTPVVIVPTYSATFIPPAPILIQQGQAVATQQSYSVQQAQQQLSYGVQAVQGQQVQAQRESVQESDLAMILRRIDKRLAVLETKCEIGPNGNGNGNGNGHNGNGNGHNGNGRIEPPGPFEPLKRDGIPKALIGCAVCHSATVAEKDGGGFVMWDKGKLAPFSERELRLMLSKVLTGQMPPPDAVKAGKARGITDEEAQELAEWIDKRQ